MMAAASGRRLGNEFILVTGKKPLPVKHRCYETFTCVMLAVETKQSGGKLPPPHSDLRGGGV